MPSARSCLLSILLYPLRSNTTTSAQQHSPFPSLPSTSAPPSRLLQLQRCLPFHSASSPS